ncbi:hypothetical protein [Halalkalibacter oceani]|uniref:hypothetical protein n=1 Tax=Halalkalibacter oceani TaxID=1653776 RepID=UPI00339B915F
MSVISKEMINEFNNLMEQSGSSIRLIPNHSSVDIKLVKDRYLNMEDQIINPTTDFYDLLIQFFKNEKVDIYFNNTGSCFWTESVSEIE